MKTQSDRNAWWLLAIYVAVTAAASLSGSLAADPDTSAWYQGLSRPSFQPPGWAFGVVWPILYLLMAYAGWRADMKATPGLKRTLRWRYGVQIVLNAAWTIAFFAMQSITGGLLVIAALWLAIVMWMIAARRADGLATLLFVPYLALVSFASALNASYLFAG